MRDLLSSIETGYSLAAFLGVPDLLRNKIDSIEEVLERISAVSPGDLLCLAREYFVDNKRIIITIGVR